MNKWIQTAVVLLFLGGFCLFACGKDQPEQTLAGKAEETEKAEGMAETADAAEITETEEKESGQTGGYGIEEAADDVADTEVHDEEYYIAELMDLAGDNSMTTAMLYQLQQPYSFILHMTEPAGGLAYDDYRFRNIAEEDVEKLNTFKTAYRGYGTAYIADRVLDKYIREYGGEDTKYHIRPDNEWWRHHSGKALYDTDCFEIYNEDVTLYVIWNGYIDGIVTVRLEDGTNTENDMQEFISYAEYSTVDYRNKHYHSGNGKYWMLINTESVRDTYCYRNVDPDEHTYYIGGAEDEALRYYIADQVIDKYIRDCQGSDTVYRVEPLQRIWGEEECDSRHGMELISGEEVLRVKYSPDSWLVDVEVLSRQEYEAYYMAALDELAGDNIYDSRAMIDVLKYQAKQPCSFLMHLPSYSGELELESYQYRNIEEDDLKWTDQDGVEYRGGETAYVVNCVLDKYIREYGGEDTLYHFKMTAEPDEHAEKLYMIYFMEIYNEDVKLHVIWNQYIDCVVNVLIEGDENAQPHMQEFVSYARYSIVDYWDKHYHHQEGTYWTLMNPEVTRNERCYRNVNPEETVSGNGTAYNMLLYDVADMALNKYIMEWLGNDTVYQAEWDIGEDGSYFIELTSGEEALQVTYQPDSWLVSVEVVRGPEE